ncbi:hypothetical protein N8T08_008490 [Aspergillus melleus]|uniref:Uncharacterized protein n=1 Tax=Aspergillus melleus TaxID=138277 RepID=A0ACC3AVZ4_9EURO|nr:hypothetical protein N8T08_008490 [Aspergillus melleus]
MSSDSAELEPINDILRTLLCYLDKGTPEYLDNVLTSDAVLIPPFPLLSVKGLPAIKQKLNDMYVKNEWWNEAAIRSIEMKSSDTAFAVSCCQMSSVFQTLVFHDDLVKDKTGWKVRRRKIILECGKSTAQKESS